MIYKVYVITRDNEYHTYASVMPTQADATLPEPEKVTMLREILLQHFDCLGVVVKEIRLEEQYETIWSFDYKKKLELRPKGDFLYRFYILNDVYEYEKISEVPTFLEEELLGEPPRITELKNIIKESNAFLEMIVIRHDNHMDADEVYDVSWLQPLTRKYTKDFKVVDD